MRVSFLFWNLNKRPLEGRVASLALCHDVDVVMLAECATDPYRVCAALTEHSGRPFAFPFSLSREIQIFTSLHESLLVPVFDDPLGHLSLRRLIVGSRGDVLLAVVHLQSKDRWSAYDQFVVAGNLARDIMAREDEVGHRRTILVGDLNMNPFEEGVVAAGALHGVMTRRIAERKMRTVAGKQYPFFYNPMWGMFGDRTDGPPGTYYYRKATPVMYYWNMFDQVLLRPDLMHALEELRILDSDAGASLLSDAGIPDGSAGSDHLPLLFRLDV